MSLSLMDSYALAWIKAHRLHIHFLSRPYRWFSLACSRLCGENADLNELYQATCTTFVRVDGDSMIQAGIIGDILVVDRSLLLSTVTQLLWQYRRIDRQRA